MNFVENLWSTKTSSLSWSCAGFLSFNLIFFLHNNDVLDEVLIAWTMLELLETRWDGCGDHVQEMLWWDTWTLHSPLSWSPLITSPQETRVQVPSDQETRVSWSLRWWDTCGRVYCWRCDHLSPVLVCECGWDHSWVHRVSWSVLLDSPVTGSLVKLEKIVKIVSWKYILLVSSLLNFQERKQETLSVQFYNNFMMKLYLFC